MLEVGLGHVLRRSRPSELYMLAHLELRSLDQVPFCRGMTYDEIA